MVCARWTPNEPHSCKHRKSSDGSVSLVSQAKNRMLLLLTCWEMERMMDRRLIDRDEVWKLFVDHYWDSFQQQRDLILCHVDAVLRMTPPVDSSRADEERKS